MKRLLLILAAFISVDQMKAEKCDTGCSYLGYDVGAFNPETNKCLCGDVKDYDFVVKNKKTVIPYKPTVRKDAYSRSFNLYD